MTPLDQFYFKQEEPMRGCLLALREMILSQDQLVTETRKWSMPCFCYKHKMFCFLWIDKKKHLPYVLFVEGNYLEHPSLKSQNRSRMKALFLDPMKDLPEATIHQLLREALDLYKNGIIRI